MKKGFTIIELFVLIAVVIISLTIIVFSVKGCSEFEIESPIDKYNTYLSNRYGVVGYSIAHSECQRVDTDGDSYVSCNATLQHTSKEPIFDNSECSWMPEQGCRQPKYSRKE